jgi:hypothetical protein
MGAVFMLWKLQLFVFDDGEYCRDMILQRFFHNSKGSLSQPVSRMLRGGLWEEESFLPMEADSTMEMGIEQALLFLE